MAAGVTIKQAKATKIHWQIWIGFCNKLQINPGLFHVRDPIPFLQVFMQSFCNGELSPSGKPVSACHAEDAACSVGQIMAELGPETIARIPKLGG
jgi:hypothetical protein